MGRLRQKTAKNRYDGQQQRVLLLLADMPENAQTGNRGKCRKLRRRQSPVAYVADNIIDISNGYYIEEKSVRTHDYAIYARGRYFGNGRKGGEKWEKKTG